ncbi:MAG: hypothetical protein CMI31_13500 [Opitutae bacterium]|jgi:hypothetical protein|nr:hypothetical protein [Opitutae bacterium]|tara:strand:+ start:1400 stop:1744 length:345 start_codon:yes stop_codon:yes gene_type:complete
MKNQENTMNKTSKIIVSFVMGLGALLVAQAQLSKPPSVPPNLPKNIPPPPSFGVSKNNNGKFQIISAEYYSQDAKPFLYKRLLKIDTTTGEAWLLHSSRGERGEIRQWLPLTGK